jgi:flagellar basal body-associated protein FliL
MQCKFTEYRLKEQTAGRKTGAVLKTRLIIIIIIIIVVLSSVVTGLFSLALLESAVR